MEKEIDYKSCSESQLKELSEKGDHVAGCFLGLSFVKKDPQKAFKLFEAAANEGLIFGLKLLGQAYLDGVGTHKNATMAWSKWKICADAGVPDSQFDVACLYEQGLGVEKDLVKAFEYYLKSAQAGFAKAQCSVAMAFRDGVGTQKDLEQAFKFFTAAAEQGHAISQHHLARFYREGWVVKKDINKAIELLEISAKNGFVFSYHNLGCIYEDLKNEKKQFEYFSKALDAGIEQAMPQLASCYLLGKGTKRDFPKAYDLLLKSRKFGSKEIDEAIRKLEEYKCKHCGAFNTKAKKQGFFGSKEICSKCGKTWR